MSDLNYNITFREKDKGWQCIVSYKEKSGKWKQKSKQGFKTKKEAKAYSNVIIKELESKQGLNKDMEGITLKEYSNIFIDHISLYKTVSTIQLYKYTFDKFKSLYNKDITKITTMDLQITIDELVKSGLSYNTMKGIKSRLSYIFKVAINQYNIINKNPASKLVITNIEKAKNKKALNKNELMELINNTDNLKYKLCLSIAGMCGLRRGEILGLTWDNIDFKKNTLTINKQWKKINTGWGFGKCKTLNSYRTIPISTFIKELFIEYRKASNISNIDNRIFDWVNPDDLSTYISSYLKRQGYNITLHELRHTYATMLISNGVDFKTAALLLGHDVEQTMKTYSHVNEDMLNKASNIIKNIF